MKQSNNNKKSRDVTAFLYERLSRDDNLGRQRATASAIKRNCLPKSQRKRVTQIWFIFWMTAFPA